jgi:hypothetical protein
MAVTPPDDRTYKLPSTLVHRAIGSIIGSICLIGGYMVIWAVNDSAFKARIEERLIQIERRMARIEERTDVHDNGKNGP